MYETYFQFSHPPFNLTPDPRFFYFSQHHEEAFHQILYGIEQRKGFILISGEAGTGKTTLCRVLLERLDHRVKTALILNTGLSALELLQAINQDLGLGGTGTSKKALLDELNRYLLETTSRDENTVVLIDEAQNLDIECLEEVRMLSNLETAREKLIQIVLLGQPELVEKLQDTRIRQLNQRIALRYRLEPLSFGAMSAYVRYRLGAAGGENRVYFTTPALRLIHQKSRGLPRLVNILCDRALLRAYVADTHVVSRAHVQSALEDLDFQEPRRLSPFLKRGWPWTAWAAAMLLLGGLGGWWAVSGPFPKEPSSAPAVSVQASMEPSHPAAVLRPPGSGGSEQTAAVVGDVTGFDPQGVYRVYNPADAERAAFATLARIWNPDFAVFPQRLASLDPDRMAASLGLQVAPYPRRFDEIVTLGYPGIVWVREDGDTTERPVVLAGVEREWVTIKDPLRGQHRLSVEAFVQDFSGRGYFFWREIPGIVLPLSVDARDPSVHALQAVLKIWGFYSGPIDGILGQVTAGAIGAFQRSRNLPVTGYLDMQTYLALAQSAVNPPAPSLHASARNRF